MCRRGALWLEWLEPKKGLDEVRTGLAMNTDGQNAVVLTHGHPTLAQILRAQGKLDEALSTLEEALRLAHRHPASGHLSGLTSQLSDLHLARGDVSAAALALDTAWREYRPSEKGGGFGSRLEDVSFQFARARLLVRQGRPDEAEEAATEAHLLAEERETTISMTQSKLEHLSAVHDPRLDPFWKDEVFDPLVWEIPLRLPETAPERGKIWIERHPVYEETVCGTPVKHEPPMIRTCIVKDSDLSKYAELTDYMEMTENEPNTTPPDSLERRVAFPPKSWMNDSGTERCMMLAAAKRARGRVLVGGLGLAIYPQIVLWLGCPVDSITIIEREPDVIRLGEETWLRFLEKSAPPIKILEAKIEDYLQDSDSVFDTIYLDTWEDAEPRLLPHVNHLVALAGPRCAPDGQILCWGYAVMLERFVGNVVWLWQEGFEWRRYRLDPALENVVTWIETHPDAGEDEVRQAALHFGLNTRASIETYDRHRCFGLLGTSMADVERRLRLARKDPGSE